jgi:hypothetical protein
MSQDIKKLSDELDAMIVKGQMREAFDKYYADDCQMQENDDAPCVGKAANLERELKAWAMAEKFAARRVHSAADGDVTYSEWEFDAQYKGMAAPMR